MSKEQDFWKSRIRESSALDPAGRISEVLFGLIMVLTFTGSISISNAGKQEVRELLWAALGCNLAWGLVDAIMYLMDEVIGRARSFSQLKRIMKSDTIAGSRETIRENISPLLTNLMSDEEVDQLSKKIRELPEPSVKKTLVLKDFLIGGQIFILVFLSTLPVALPFLFINDVSSAMRISNGVAVVLLFAGGFALARYSGLRPVLTALIYTAIGVLFVGITMALGG